MKLCSKQYLWFSIFILILFTSCSFHSPLKHSNIQISENELKDFKLIQEEISYKFDEVTKNNGMLSDRFYFETNRFREDLGTLSVVTKQKLNQLHQKGTLLSIRIRKENCILFLLELSDSNYLLHDSSEEAWLVYNNNCEIKCGDWDDAYNKSQMLKQIDSNWSIVINTRKRYVGG